MTLKVTGKCKLTENRMVVEFTLLRHKGGKLSERRSFTFPYSVKSGLPCA